MRAKKSLGQNFLKSDRALAKIVESGNIVPGDFVLEIGPGTGALTERLLVTGAKVIAVEKDDNLFEVLKEKFKTEINKGKLELFHKDILDFDIENCKLKIENYKIIANIPYNITGAILKKFLSLNHQPSRVVLLVQKEVAQRIVATDGRGSILSISVKAYGEPHYVETVKAGSFVPAPKVDSAILLIENISKDFFTDFSEVDFFKLLQASFQSKRKKLSSNLSRVRSTLEDPLWKQKVTVAFQKMALDDNIRAENLSIADWKSLTEQLLS